MKAACAGAGLALTAGLLLGAAMKPDLAADDRPAGPQILAGRSGARAAGPFDDGLAFARYSGKVPDYVLGADWRKLVEAPAATPPEAEDVAPESYYVSPLRDDPPEPQLQGSELTRAGYENAAAERVSFPSLDGEAAYEDVSRVEKTPLMRTAEIEDEARPEATGDTRRAR